MEKSNEQAVSGSPYLYRSNSKHMVVIVIPKESTDINYLKTIISDFHINDIGNELFEISALLMGLDKHLLMIKTFDSVKESLVYYELILENNKILEVLRKTNYKIMSISIDNFKDFYKNKDIEGYYKFFTNNYLTIN